MIDGRPSSCRGGEQPAEGAGALPVPQTGRGAAAGLPPGSADHGGSGPRGVARRPAERSSTGKASPSMAHFTGVGVFPLGLTGVFFFFSFKADWAKLNCKQHHGFIPAAAKSFSFTTR